jgi:hypothetical protein
MRQISFLLRCLLGENVAFKSVFSLDFTASSDCESLLCTGFSFHFWHFSLFLKVSAISNSLDFKTSGL